jgi:uncharacterized membrane protein
MTKGNQERLSATLGWISIGIGAAEIFAPRAVARFIGMPDHKPLRAIGVREIVSGLGLLSQPHEAGWMWSRVGGDAMDLALLTNAMTDERSEKKRLAMATIAVAGLAAADAMASMELSRNGQGKDDGALVVRRSVTIDRSARELYDHWRDFENLPRFMRHLESVTVQADGKSHWVAKGPLGKKIEWDAEIVDEQPGQFIAWRSLPHADVENEGVVRFTPAHGNRGTVVQVQMRYKPPAGKLGAAVARLLGEEPDLQFTDDLRAFKQIMEVGEVVRSDGSLEGGHVVQHPGQPAAVAA